VIGAPFIKELRTHSSAASTAAWDASSLRDDEETPSHTMAMTRPSLVTANCIASSFRWWRCPRSVTPPAMRPRSISRWSRSAGCLWPHSVQYRSGPTVPLHCTHPPAPGMRETPLDFNADKTRSVAPHDSQKASSIRTGSPHELHATNPSGITGDSALKIMSVDVLCSPCR
jgi:hypothetical protein